MSNTTRKNTNTENFNEMMRRSSNRLRGGSVPPPDSDIVVPTPAIASRRGRGRGRGRENCPTSNRNRNQSSFTPVVRLTVPGEEQAATEPAMNTSTGVPPNSQDPPEATGTSVLHSGGLLSRDDVNFGQNTRSPTRRNTVTMAGDSPPRGFHSWLKANGYTVVSKTPSDQPALNGINATINKVVTPSQTVQTPSVTHQVSKEKTSTRKAPIQVNLTKDDDVSKSTEKKKVKVSDAGIEVNGLVVLSPYFDAKMKPFEGYIPLSIFNPQWLRLDLVRQSQRVKKKKDSDDDRYNGLEIPDEWRMNFDVADKFVIHKENVMAIKQECSSEIMAFCYDQAIRSTVMTFKNADGKLANPAIRDENQECDARLETEGLGDFQPRFQSDNPYAEGQPKANIHPITGEYQAFSNHKQYSNTNTNANQATDYGKPNACSWLFANPSMKVRVARVTNTLRREGVKVGM
ncbi:uncharacterized protein MELLADRAFT_92612 [Melampsora larici-populina 98AG31]|uniref:Uncharacterized protein n=1 Tax=Melampsora larici-populina (strain 98AG31 / pathotype 3-4-7) TaxID=747676 RepID=F4S267_MELLP|nr:uncharacterized protein MELLADRAFT_92612 [Melampsora larici-populina 98AG31]EGG01309.1 hypothetical protein MELLADRAFT_92612 [Melampsora larici-populina 98AG31]